MKKLFLLTAIASSLFLTSCTSDDTQTLNVEQPEPVVAAKTLEVKSFNGVAITNVFVYKENANGTYTRISEKHPTVAVHTGDHIRITTDVQPDGEQEGYITYRYNTKEFSLPQFPPKSPTMPTAEGWIFADLIIE